MQYKYCPNNPERFATNLRRDLKTKNLMWDNARGQDVLIIQTPFGESAISRISDICNALEKATIFSDKYTEILSGVWIRFVTATDKARNNGCVLNGEASTYTVLSCVTEGDVTSIFEPKNQAMISSYCDIPLELHIDIKKVMRKEGLFKKREVETGFYSMEFPAGFSNGYKDGSLQYKIEEFVIPITRTMIEHRIVYIKTITKPVLISQNKGLRLV